jgi:Tfp pilus assembly protein PilN
VRGLLGIDLDARMLRAVRVDGWRGRRARVMETAWDPNEPGEGVGVLRETMGSAARIAVAVHLPLLLAKRVKLPPLPPAERRRVLQLEPQRFFPVRLEDLVIAVADHEMVFAAREAPLTAWIKELGRLGPIELLEPGPAALARALGKAGTRDGLVLLDHAERGVGLIELRQGEIARVRRIYGGFAGVAAALEPDSGRPMPPVYLAGWDEERAGLLTAHLRGVRVLPLQALAGVAPPFLSAYGAALGVGSEPGASLMTEKLSARRRRRRHRTLAGAALACVSAALFALTSYDAWRQRIHDNLATRIEGLETRASVALGLQHELTAMQRRAQAVAEIERTRPDPLRVLLAVSRRLPPGAYLRALRLSGAEWQIDGYGQQAAGVTQALGSAPEFQAVRFLAATNRAQMGSRTYETFSIAFRFVPAP